MAAQTSVTSPLAGYAGLLADASFTRKKVATSEEAADEIRFGICVGQGADVDGALKLAANDDVLKGIVIADQTKAKDVELGDTGLKPKVTFDVLVEGPIWVLVDGNGAGIAPGAEVHVRAVAVMAEVAGAFRASKDGTDTINISQFARWESGVEDGPGGTKIALLWANFAGAALATADS